MWYMYTVYVGQREIDCTQQPSQTGPTRVWLGLTRLMQTVDCVTVSRTTKPSRMNVGERGAKKINTHRQKESTETVPVNYFSQLKPHPFDWRTYKTLITQYKTRIRKQMHGQRLVNQENQLAKKKEKKKRKIGYSKILSIFLNDSIRSYL